MIVPFTLNSLAGTGTSSGSPVVVEAIDEIVVEFDTIDVLVELQSLEIDVEICQC